MADRFRPSRGMICRTRARPFQLPNVVCRRDNAILCYLLQVQFHNLDRPVRFLSSFSLPLQAPTVFYDKRKLHPIITRFESNVPGCRFGGLSWIICVDERVNDAPRTYFTGAAGYRDSTPRITSLCSPNSLKRSVIQENDALFFHDIFRLLRHQKIEVRLANTLAVVFDGA